jgi:hypothetical protein
MLFLLQGYHLVDSTIGDPIDLLALLFVPVTPAIPLSFQTVPTRHLCATPVTTFRLCLPGLAGEFSFLSASSS